MENNRNESSARKGTEGGGTNLRKIAAAAVVVLVAIAALTVAGGKLRRMSYEPVNPFDALIIHTRGESPDVFLETEWNPNSPFLEHVELEIPNTLSGLKNGDKITISARVEQSVSDKYKMKLSETEYTYTVDVPDYEAVDPFAALDIRLEGTSPYLSLQYAQMSDDPFLREVWISVDRNLSLSSGDTVTFTAEVDSYVCDTYRKKLSNTSMTYTVASDTAYITQEAALTDPVRSALSDLAVHSIGDALQGDEYADHIIARYLAEHHGQDISPDFARAAVTEYSVRPLSVLVEQQDAIYQSRIFIACEVSADYELSESFGDEHKETVTDTCICCLEYVDAITDGSDILSFDDYGICGVYPALEDMGFEVRRDHGIAAEITLSDLNQNATS